jgi:hypothetical protein
MFLLLLAQTLKAYNSWTRQARAFLRPDLECLFCSPVHVVRQHFVRLLDQLLSDLLSNLLSVNMCLYAEIYYLSNKLRSRTKNGRTTFTVGQTTGRSKHYVGQHDVEQQPPHLLRWGCCCLTSCCPTTLFVRPNVGRQYWLLDKIRVANFDRQGFISIYKHMLTDGY